MESSTLNPIFILEIDGIKERKSVKTLLFCNQSLAYSICDVQGFFCVGELSVPAQTNVDNYTNPALCDDLGNICNAIGYFCEDNLSIVQKAKDKLTLSSDCLIDSQSYDFISVKGKTSKDLKTTLKHESGSASNVATFSVEIIDHAQKLTKIFGQKNEFDVLGKIATFKVTYDKKKSSSEVLFKGNITNISAGAGFITFRISQVQLGASKSDFELKEFKLASDINSSNTSAFNSLLDREQSEFFSVNAIVGDEIVSVVNSSIVRGQLNTIATDHDKDTEVKEFLILKGNPIDLALWLLEFVAIVDISLVDVNKFIFVRDFILIGAPEVNYKLDEEIETIKFIEKEIFAPLNIYAKPSNDGRYSVGYSLPLSFSGDLAQVNCDNVLNPSRLELSRDLTKYFYNIISYQHDYDELTDEVQELTTVINAEALTLIDFKRSFLDVEAKAYDESAKDWFTYQGRRLSNRYGHGAEYCAGVQLFYSAGANLEVGDIVLFGKGLNLSDFNNNTREYSPKLFEIVSKKVNYVTAVVTVDLLSLDYDTNASYGVIATDEFGGFVGDCYVSQKYDDLSEENRLNHLFIAPSVDVEINGTTITFNPVDFDGVQNAQYISLSDDCLNGISKQYKVGTITANTVNLFEAPLIQGNAIMHVNGFTDNGLASAIL